jgi:hypothetical protein
MGNRGKAFASERRATVMWRGNGAQGQPALWLSWRGKEPSRLVATPSGKIKLDVRSQI